MTPNIWMKLAKESIVRWSAHWHNLANTIEAPMCCGDAAFLSNYFDHLFNSGFNHIFGTVFSERELTFTFAICYRPSVCRLSVVCRM